MDMDREIADTVSGATHPVAGYITDGIDCRRYVNRHRDRYAAGQDITLTAV